MTQTRNAPKMVDVFSDVELDTKLATNAAGVAIAEMADANPNIVTLAADVGAVLADFRARHPQRYLELGIAETNSVSVAAGLATCGYLPYIFSMAPFGVLKCAEQIRTDLAYTRLPVRLVGRLTGLAMGIFGTSHHAVEDIAIARALTNLTVLSPADSHATLSLMRSTEQHPGPIYIRISEGAGQVYAEPPVFEFGRWLRLREGADVSMVGYGMGVGLAVRAAEELATHGVHADVYDAAYLKPFDAESIVDTARRTGAVVTIEEHSEVGGLFSIVAETLGRHGVPARLDRAALPDENLEVGFPADLYAHYGLTIAGVVAKAWALLGRD